MIIIYPEKQTGVAATSQDANWPASNLLTPPVKKKWQAASGVNSATVTVSIASGAKYLYLGGTNAVTATVVVKNGAGATQSTTVIALTASGRAWNRFWCEYTQLDEAHTVEITLTATAGLTVYAGIVRAGAGVQVENPNFGLKHGKVDYSIVHEMSDGSEYVHKRDVVRKLTGTIEVDNADFFKLSDLYDYYGPRPFACLVAEGFDERQWCLFCKMSDPDDGSYEEAVSPISIILLEAL